MLDLGVSPVLSAAGTVTTKGASPVKPEVMKAVGEISGGFVEISDLQARVSARLAKILGTEAAYVVNCCAAGVAVAVAACLTDGVAGAVEALPDTNRLDKATVVIPKGHCVDFDANITQAIRLTGASVREIGAVNHCDARQLEYALGADVACAVYVASFHAVQSGMLDLEAFVRGCQEKGVPVVVDAAAEPDPRIFLQKGADLVVFSGHKRFQALTSGVIAGRAARIEACRAQGRGIGRLVKAGKENIFSAAAALDAWAKDNHRTDVGLEEKNARALEALSGAPGLTAELAVDVTSQSFSRVRLVFGGADGPRAAIGLCEALAARTPPIFVRNDAADRGVLELDFRVLDMATTERICAEIVTVAQAAG